MNVCIMCNLFTKNQLDTPTSHAHARTHSRIRADTWLVGHGSWVTWVNKSP